MPDDYKKFIDKVIYGILATIGVVLVKFIGDLNQNTQNLMIQLSKITTQLEYHETQLRSLDNSNQNIFRIETELGMHEKRLSILERAKR